MDSTFTVKPFSLPDYIVSSESSTFCHHFALRLQLLNILDMCEFLVFILVTTLSVLTLSSVLPVNHRMDVMTSSQD